MVRIVLCEQQSTAVYQTMGEKDYGIEVRQEATEIYEDIRGLNKTKSNRKRKKRSREP